MLAWLRDVASNGQRFRELEAQGRKRIAHHIDELRESLRSLETEGAAIEERVEARIQELTKTRTEAVRESIEKSILDLRQRKKTLEEKQTFVLDAIRQTESILKNHEDQFTRYSRSIRKALDQTGEALKLSIQSLISRLLLMDTEIKLALSPLQNCFYLLALKSCQQRRHDAHLRFILPGSTLKDDKVIPTFKPPFGIIHRMAQK